MNRMNDEQLDEYYREAESWSHDRIELQRRALRFARIAAAVAALIAVMEALALVVLLPLKRDVPYTLLVDRETGYVEAVRPLEDSKLTADAALTRSFLVQYVTARESFDIDSLQDDYRKVGLLSADRARSEYVSLMSSTNPLSPLASLPRRATIAVQIRSVSSLAPDRAMVRFSTVRTDPGGQPQLAQHWVALIGFRYSGANMTAADRLINPLGFQVISYRRDAETLPEEIAIPPQPVRIPARTLPPPAGVPTP
jgi:type IV secretion system protein VirB8